MEREQKTLRLTIHLDEIDMATMTVLQHESGMTNSARAEHALRNHLSGWRKNLTVRRKAEALLGYPLPFEMERSRRTTESPTLNSTHRPARSD